MTSLRIVTDSMADFPSRDYLQDASVVVVPHSLALGQQRLEETPGVELIDLHHLFEAEENLPRLEAPSVERMAEVYNSIQKETDVILSIHASSALSEAFANARAACQQFLGRCDIHVIDSKSFSIGQGLLVEAAARCAAAEGSLDEAVRVVRSMLPRLYTIFFLKDLAYLERSRLVSRSQSILGTMLDIIPFVTLEDGRLIPMEKVRHRPRALEKLIEFVAEFTDVEKLAILQDRREAGEDAAWLTERLEVMHPEAEITISSYTPSLATHIGPGSLGILVLEKELERPG